MDIKSNNGIFRTVTSIILYTAGLIILLWFLLKILSIVLLGIFAIVLGLIINAPVSRLEKKGMKRWLASLIVFFIIFGITALLGWMVVPHMSDQLDVLIGNLPKYYASVSGYLDSLLRKFPELRKEMSEGGSSISSAIPSIGNTVMGIGNFSFSILGGIFVFIVFVCMVVFFVGNPKPIIELYLTVFPVKQREKAENAIKHTSVMLVGWMKSNLIGGAIEAVLVYGFLTLMNVPGALVWAALAFFSELVPKIGFYIMAIPPTLVALSVSPATALWCLVFFLLLNELISDFLMPKLRSSTMNIHPMSSLFLLLAMGTAFGLTGALLSTPLAAIIKAYYEEFYLRQFPEDPQLEQRTNDIVY
ncbi:Predicted PurR-regulated permease PerM [Pedobacter suwonensis]|uniref:Predicted PurR-regulated permease PerM n=1 Tax=Pedobacter suwonensis TaxID=332999 RepID=A0A1I0SMX4_9SPHI|nr:AI-2E family transporter [Pedobacter suwonensis]SFA40871.1 Predicted PurR-regulated permease PerM [Pedobacter suwonensis]